jgi:hypothetical protein
VTFLELRTPRDMLMKAKREHGKLTANFDIDNVFNFFVTANHIRDYIEKNRAVPHSIMEEFLRDQDIRDGRDLCDKAKHLRLTKRADPLTHRWSGTIGGAPLATLPIGADGEWELWSDGREVNIARLADRVIDKWDEFFSAADSDYWAQPMNRPSYAVPPSALYGPESSKSTRPVRGGIIY